MKRLAEPWSGSGASRGQSLHFDFILFLLSYGFGFHLQDKSNILRQTAVCFHGPPDIYQSNEDRVRPGGEQREICLEPAYCIIVLQTKFSRSICLLVQSSSLRRHFPLVYWKPESRDWKSYLVEAVMCMQPGPVPKSTEVRGLSSGLMHVTCRGREKIYYPIFGLYSQQV